MANTGNTRVEELFNAGAHVGYSKSRKHPSTEPFLHSQKDRVQIIDLEKAEQALSRAEEFLTKTASSGKQVLFVGTKPEVRDIVRRAAKEVEQPYVINRWIGGTLTNFSEIRKRAARLKQLREERESGELERKYTKRERLMVDREIERLEERVGGLVDMEQLPAAVIIVDPHYESIAATEVERVDIPVIALAGTDCNIKNVEYPIVANDTMRKSVEYILSALTAAFRGGKKNNGESAKTETKTSATAGTTE